MNEIPKFTSALDMVMAGMMKRPPTSGENAYISMVPNCICCEKSMIWLHGATKRIVRCETLGCPQYKVEFQPPKLKLELA